MDQPKNFINLIGQTFGELYVFERAGSDNDGSARFLARCSCGNESRYDSIDLRRFKRTACSKCLREAGKKATIEKREAAAQKILEERIESNKEKYDISGLKVKNWTVLEPVKAGNFGGKYTCECKCGTLFSFNRNTILNEKTSRFCKKCLLEENKRARTKRREEVLERESANCPKCNLELKINDFDKSSLKRGIFICCKCNREYLKEMKEKWFEENSLKDRFDCPKCNLNFEKSDIPESFLKTKNPLCKNCNKIGREKLADKYEKNNLKKKEIECSRCKITKPLDQYPPSFLRSSSPMCSSCNMSCGNDYDKKKMKSDPIYKEKRDIGRKIAQSLSKRNWVKGFTAIEYLGIDRGGFIKHLESLFRGGMSWSNRNEWEIDHVIPTSFAETSDEIKILWHHLNLQPLWCWENNRKSNSLNWREQEWTKELLDIRSELKLDDRWKMLEKEMPSRFFREPFC